MLIYMEMESGLRCDEEPVTERELDTPARRLPYAAPALAQQEVAVADAAARRWRIETIEACLHALRRMEG